MGKGKCRLTKGEIDRATEVAVKAGLLDGRCRLVIDYQHQRIEVVPTSGDDSAGQAVANEWDEEHGTH
jgi:hypothetical protein